jgi:lipopolysaccharide transport system ATP-binding protein
MLAIKQICDRVVWLKEGRIEDEGDAKSVINNYLNSSKGSTLEKSWSNGDEPGNDKAKIKSIRVLSQQTGQEVITTDTPIKIELIFENKQVESEINLSFVLWTLSGECIFNTASEVKLIGEGTYKGVCFIPGNLLNNNVYSVEVMVIKDRSHAVYKMKDIINFEVADGKRVEGWYGKWVGAVRPNLKFNLEKV